MRRCHREKSIPTMKTKVKSEIHRGRKSTAYLFKKYVFIAKIGGSLR